MRVSAAAAAVMLTLLACSAAAELTSITIEEEESATSTPPGSFSDTPSNDSITDSDSVESSAPSETRDAAFSSPVSKTAEATSAPAQRFSCLYDDGVSDLYTDKLNGKNTIFQCHKGTKCYQRPNKYVEIQCAYPASMSSFASSTSTATNTIAIASSSDSSSDAETSVSNDSSIDSNAESTSSTARGTDSFANFASAIYAPAQFAATPTSSEPRVLSVNVVLPTIAIKITDDPGAPDAATVITIGAATSTSTQLRAVPFFKGPDDGLTTESSSSAAANVESQPTSSPVRLGGPALSSRTRIPDELPSVSAQERRKITIDDKDLFSILYMSDIQPQNIESLSSPPASPMRALTPTPSSTVPAFTGSQPPGMPSSTIKGDTGLLRPSSSEPSLLMPEQMLQALPQAFATQSSLPQSAPVSSARVVQSLPLPTGAAVASAPNLKPPVPQPIVQPTLTQPPPSTLTLNQLPTPLPTPTNPPATFYSLPAPQGVPQSVLAPLITVILHPAFAPLPATAPSLVPVPPLSTMAPILPPLPQLPAPSRTSAPKKDLLLANEQASGSLDPVYPQYTPIIPFISDGFRRPTPSLDDSDMLSKGAINAGGIASILQDVFHVPAEKITIDGKPVVINGPGHSGSGGISVVVMDPEDQKKGPSQHRGVKGAADDDDDDDDFMDDFGDDSDSETTTHSLNVDRAKHRNHAHAHAQAHARGRLEKSTLDSDAVNAKGAANDGYDSDGYSSDDSNDSNDSDDSDGSDDEGNGNIKTDEDTALGHATPTSTASSSAESESPTPTSRRRKHLHDLTDTGEPSTSSRD